MSEERKYYVLCGQNCKFESMTKEQILTAITQAVNEGTIGDIDTGFVTTIKTINDKALKFFVGTQSEYEALTDEEKNDVFAIITNDTTKESMQAQLNEILTEIAAMNDFRVDLSELTSDVENLKTSAEEQATFNESILSGDVIAKSAECDADGNVISKTYKPFHSPKIANQYPYESEETIDLDHFTSGSFFITRDQIASDLVLNLPEAVKELMRPYANLSVCNTGGGYIQTLEVMHYINDSEFSFVFRRRYFSGSVGWSAWVRLATVEELTSGDLVVNKAETAESATNATNATKINNLEITKDENGVLKIGDVIIPQKTLLLNETKNVRDLTSIIFNIPTDITSVEIYTDKGIFKVPNNASITICCDYNGTTPDSFISFAVTEGTLYCSYSYYHNGTLSTTATATITKVYSVVE